MLVNLIRRLGQAGKTIVTATHELEIVPIIANRVIVLGENRQILADGPAQQVLDDTELLVKANLIYPELHYLGRAPSSFK